MPIQIVVVGYIMWQSIGIYTLIGFGSLFLLTIPIQAYASILSGKLRASIAGLTDRRVQLMSELVAGIQVIKMYAWEKPFNKIVSQTRLAEIKKIHSSSNVSAVRIELDKVSANWIIGQLPPILCDVTLKVKPGELCTLVGPVGSGKSSLLNLLLQELPVSAGTVGLFQFENEKPIGFKSKHRFIQDNPEMTISYASQDPWLFSGTIRENILFGLEYDHTRYREVTRVCSLLKDFQQFPNGDLTSVGERGASLSGGQRARVNLARAIYKQADLYLLDDPLSAVDARVARILFNECISKHLHGKTRILVTHQLNYLKQADTIAMIDRGCIKHQGTFDTLMKINPEFNNLLNNMKTNDTESLQDANENHSPKKLSEEVNFFSRFDKSRTSRISIRSQDSYQFLPYQEFTTAECNTQVDSETMESGRMSNKVYYRYFREGGTCIVGCIVLVILRSFFFMHVCMNAGRKLHNHMFSNVLQATMNFFHTNPSGRILNRFSKDVGAMDELLPRAMLEAIQIFLVMTGILVIITSVNPWMGIPILRTLNDWRVLQKSSFSHVSTTLDGLMTIRSRGKDVERMLCNEFDHYQDIHTGAWYLTITTGSAFGLILDLISCVFVTCVCYSLILMDPENTFGGSVGLAISQSLILTGMLQYGVKQTAEVQSQMTSVERIIQYTDLPKEGPMESTHPPPSDWPSKGDVKWQNVSMSYKAEDPPVLKNIDLVIESGWKVGVVGRTGAGKSSLISALFRLADDGLQGKIIIDDLDTKSIGLQDLRAHISIIPQEPILFSETLRYNLDPFGLTTANIDSQTDAMIQRTIRTKFANCTVITIAHRLNTIIDSDRVLVMDNGNAAEFGSPYELLIENSKSMFAEMVDQTGSIMAEKLREEVIKYHNERESFETFDDDENQQMYDIDSSTIIDSIKL
ncbi:hypothetical protein KQX54_006034 [Cotesia glomerata]|uniref:Uncharacterized protein n=1 Tax=Cotesia glomerata TaxID=32391 RepID=A0AAV7HRH0_COTGL|nr:hypothetical protein KQX54_006034 [Cotesia glomerata]